MSQMTTRARNWVFTINNYNKQDLRCCRSGVDCDGGITFIFFGFEEGKNGTPHLQGFLQLSKQLRAGSVRDLLGGRAHVEPMKGTPEDNVRYCSKEGDCEEYGTLKKAGRRTDISAVREAVTSGMSMKQITEVATSYQSLKYAAELMKYAEPERDWEPFVTWAYGPTGKNKSRDTRKTYPNAYWCMETNKWWDGYDAHEDVVIDDYRCDFCKFRMLLRLLDSTPLRVECKGGTRQLLAKNIVITAPYHPLKMWKHRTAEDLGQLMRRIDLIIPYGCEEYDPDESEDEVVEVKTDRRNNYKKYTY